MLLSAVSVLVVAQSSSEIPEGLMNNPVFSTDTVRCVSSSGDLQFFFVKRIHNSHFGNNWRRNNEYGSF